MIESFALGLRLYPDLFVVQREELWTSCIFHVPLNSILNLRAMSGEESRKKRGRPGRAYTAVNEAWFFPSVTMKCQRAFFRGSWFIRILIDCFQGLDWAPAFR